MITIEAHTRRPHTMLATSRFRLCAGPILVLLAACTASCAQVKQHFVEESTAEPPTELQPVKAEIEPIEIWTRNVGDGVSEEFLKLRPAYAGQRLFAAEREGEVSAYNLQDGNQLWSVRTELDISGGPGVAEGHVLVGTSDGEVVAFEATRGAVKWRARLSSEVLAAPTGAQGIVVARTNDGKLFGLSLSDGKRLWVYDRSVPVLTLRGTSSPVVTGDLVIAGFDSGRLVALRLANGLPVWERRIAMARGRSELERLVDIDADPIVRDGVVYAVSFQGRVMALDLTTGDTIWQRDMSSHSGMGIGPNNVYVTDERSHVWALDRSNSGSLWRQQNLQGRNLTAPGVLSSVVVMADFEGYVHWLSVDDGRIMARTRVGAGVIAPPVVVDDQVYILDQDGEITAYRAG